MVSITIEFSQDYFRKIIEVAERSKKEDPNSPFKSVSHWDEYMIVFTVLGKCYVENILKEVLKQGKELKEEDKPGCFGSHGYSDPENCQMCDWKSRCEQSQGDF